MTPERRRQIGTLGWLPVYLAAATGAAIVLVPNPRPLVLAGLVFGAGGWVHGYIVGRSRSR